MRFKIGDKVIYTEDYSDYGGTIWDHRGEIVGYPKGNDVGFGEYEVRWFHEYFKHWNKCICKEKDLKLC